jgi:uncharacterized lipoprotein YmbA
MTTTNKIAAARSLPLLALLLALTACSAAPTQFYTLLPPPSAPQAATPSFQIEVQPVDLPPQVSTPELVVRTGSGEMVPVDTRRWIAPLGDEIRGALSADLSRRLGAHDVYGLPNSVAATGQGVPTWRITVKVQRFESALGAYARVDALWSLRRAGDNMIAAACGSSVSETVQAGYPALVEGHQRVVDELAGQIAAALVAAQQGGGLSCPAS